MRMVYGSAGSHGMWISKVTYRATCTVSPR
jgi:hypothetical protein